mmetsp:Transcript_83038/g.216484  ORF Transcript_83038/g.216484 Transcript_83038/m.216484 type:complete len:225 (-) Transcript_83038:602-1276(-)
MVDGTTIHRIWSALVTAGANVRWAWKPEHGLRLPCLPGLEYDGRKRGTVGAVGEMLRFKAEAGSPFDRHTTLSNRVVAQIVPCIEMHSWFLSIQVDRSTSAWVQRRGIGRTCARPKAICIRFNAQEPGASVTSPDTTQRVPQCHVVVKACCNLELLVLLLDPSPDRCRCPEVKGGVVHAAQLLQRYIETIGGQKFICSYGDNMIVHCLRHGSMIPRKVEVQVVG